ncbi:MAG: hypothetical protein Q8P42_05470 [Gallionella sp.]|nr:hypothetical protein [Gallionella sp.]
MSDLKTFATYYTLADRLIEKVTKDDLAETVRLLALNIAHYQSIYGELPLGDTLSMLGNAQPNDEQLEILNSGMEILVGVLGNVVSGIDQERH